MVKPVPTIVSSGHTPFHKRGNGSGNFRCSHFLHRNSFTCIAQALRPHNYFEKELLVVSQLIYTL